jgi:hypothetical protein
VIELPGGVRVTVSVPYFRRQKDPAKAAAEPGLELYPALMLLGIVKGRTPHVRQRMVKAAALLEDSPVNGTAASIARLTSGL